MNKDVNFHNKFASEEGLQKVIEIVQYFSRKYQGQYTFSQIHRFSLCTPKHLHNSYNAWGISTPGKEQVTKINETESILNTINAYSQNHSFRFKYKKDHQLNVRIYKILLFKIKKYQQKLPYPVRRPKSIKRSMVSKLRKRNHGKFVKKSCYSGIPI